jgi:hypothetical protein
MHPATFEGLASIESIELTKCRVTRIVPGLFGSLDSLCTLDLSSNRLVACPPSQELGRIENLNLSDNRISTVEGAFDGDRGSNRTLRYLNLGANAIEHLPPFGFARLGSLRSLVLASNKLESLPSEALSGLFTLQELDLSSTGLKSIAADLFSDLINLKGTQKKKKHLSYLFSLFLECIFFLFAYQSAGFDVLAIATDRREGLLQVQESPRSQNGQTARHGILQAYKDQEYCADPDMTQLQRDMKRFIKQ